MWRAYTNEEACRFTAKAVVPYTRTHTYLHIHKRLYKLHTCKHTHTYTRVQQPAVAAKRTSEASGPQGTGLESVGVDSKGTRALTPRDLHKLLWAWAKFNRHPGQELLQVGN